VAAPAARLYSVAIVRDAKPGRVVLAVAAEALEAELRRFEDLAEALGRERLDSEKNLRRAAQALLALQEADARLAGRLAALVAAIGAARERQELNARAVQGHAEVIRQRSEVLSGLMERWEALGRAAGEVTRLAQHAATPGGDSNGDERRDALAEIADRLTGLAESAQALTDAARAAEFADLARQADGLRLQVLAARNKLRLARGRG
jgi:DNA repair exonuclease SbcCD ATPase subunit